MSEQMKAIRFHEYGGSEKLILETIPRPVPQTNEVLIKVHFAGVNPIDWKFRAGLLKNYMPVQLPSVPGIDVSGTIEALGSEVKTLKKGQAVFGVAKGAYAEYAIALAADVAVKPDNLSFEVAATLPVGVLTGWKAVEDAGIKTGQTVVVLSAAGGVGLGPLGLLARLNAPDRYPKGYAVQSRRQTVNHERFRSATLLPDRPPGSFLKSRPVCPARATPRRTLA